jgi:hypothetical protein
MRRRTPRRARYARFPDVRGRLVGAWWTTGRPPVEPRSPGPARASTAARPRAASGVRPGGQASRTAFNAASLTVAVLNPHAMAVENDVFKMRPVPPEVRDALLAAVDALALHAVISLNKAHGLLVNAGAVIGPPPSDQWYRLIEQLTERQDVVGRNQQERRLCVGAAAFLAAEAHRLEDHCAALSDDAGQTVVQERVQKIVQRYVITGPVRLRQHNAAATLINRGLRDKASAVYSYIGDHGNTFYYSLWLIDRVHPRIYELLKQLECMPIRFHFP